MKILITGGNGFIARNLAELLPKRYSLLALNSKELDLLDSGRTFEYLKANRFDAVIHSSTYDAAPRHSLKDPAKVLENNLRMFFNLTRSGAHFGKMIYFGSGAEFSRQHWLPKMKENYFDTHVPADQYGLSKYIMAKYALAHKNIINLRLFAVFGKYEDWRVRFISNACCRALFGLPIVANQDMSFDFICIEDLARIVEWFIDNTPKNNIYNVCSGRAESFRSIADSIVRVSGKKINVVFKKEGAGIEYSGDNALLLKELKDFSFTPIKESLKSLYSWYELNKSIIDKDKLTEVQ